MATSWRVLSSPAQLPGARPKKNVVLALQLLFLVGLTIMPDQSLGKNMLDREVKKKTQKKDTPSQPAHGALPADEVSDNGKVQQKEGRSSPEEKDAQVEIDYDTGDVGDAWANIYLDHATGKLKGKRPDPEEMREQERLGRKKPGTLLEGNSPLLRQEHRRRAGHAGAAATGQQGAWGWKYSSSTSAASGSGSKPLLRGFAERQEQASLSGQLPKDVKATFGLGEMTEEEENLRLATHAEEEALKYARGETKLGPLQWR